MEQVDENNLQAFQALQDTLADKLNLDPESICIQHIHRVGRIPMSRFSGPIKHRDLIAAFRDFQDVKLIISNAHKLQDSGIGVNRNLPKEILDLDTRKPLWTKYKEEKASDPNAKLTIAYPVKLIKDGRVIADTLPEQQTIVRKSRFNEPSLNMPVFPEPDSKVTRHVPPLKDTRR